MALDNNGKVPNYNGKALLCHCAAHLNHLEQRSCFYYPEVRILGGISIASRFKKIFFLRKSCCSQGKKKEMKFSRKNQVKFLMSI